MAACFMANCQVLSFDKVLNGQKVKPTHRTHTHTPLPPLTHTHDVAHKLRTKLPEQNTQTRGFLWSFPLFTLPTAPTSCPRSIFQVFLNMENFWSGGVESAGGEVPGKCKRKAARRFLPIHTYVCFAPVCVLWVFFLESVIV